MSVLRSIESKLEALFEGVFGRAFRSNVQPVELARKLVKEMDDHRSVSVSRVYVPNEYSVYLAPADRRQFADYEPQLLEELQDYLAEHARRERYVLLTGPKVKLETDEELAVGEFGIATRLVRGPRTEPPVPRPEPPVPRPEPPVPRPEPAGVTTVYRPEPNPEPEPSAEAAAHVPAVLTVAGERYELGSHPIVLGRSKECEIRISDPNVSRRHAEVRPTATGYTIVDLDSTNGIEVGGKRLKTLELTDGAAFMLGSTEVVYTRGTAA